jgi:biotin synthase-related radical SAM superfamily protein
MPKKQFYTVSEAAKALKIGRAAVHAAIKAGRLHAEWTTITQTVTRRAYVISAKQVKDFRVDKGQQARGKKKP